MSEFRIPTMTKRVTLTNLAVDGSFEDALNNWNVWLAEPTDTSQAKDGSCSLKLGGDALAGSKATVHLIAGHKYYGREYIKTAGELTAADCRFEFCGAVDGVEKAFVFGWNRGNYPDWTAISGIITSDGTYDFGLRTFTVAGSCNAWVDSIVVIDLTADFGEGNEPTKEWCDANIPYFSGSYEVDIPVSSPIQALVTGLTIPEGVVTQITDVNGRVLWRATINFIINGNTYVANRGMTWAEWFVSTYNTMGETEGIIEDAVGNEISLDAVIVKGAEYRFIKTYSIKITGNSDAAEVWIQGTKYNYPATVKVPHGTQVTFCARNLTERGACRININHEGITTEGNEVSYIYTVIRNISVRVETNSLLGSSWGVVHVTEE